MKTSEMSRSAVAVIEAKDHYLLEARPDLPGKLACAGKLALFGGGVERGEAPISAILRELFDEELNIPGNTGSLESLDQVWQGVVWGPSGKPKVVNLFVARVDCPPDQIRLHPDLVATGTDIKSYPLGIYPPASNTTRFTMQAVDTHFHRDYTDLKPVMVLYGASTPQPVH